MPEQFPGMKLGHLLGKGSYGRVFRGSWRGQTIAAKVRRPATHVHCCRVGMPFRPLPHSCQGQDDYNVSKGPW